ncbi:MAG: hypothetical protein KIT84_14735 [Labilithrix sp.]|nr:hypothetical protein [Labilithrix sp.]MCW5812278.1 hypothetical protein [Labilithrix sp.]
MLFACGDDPDPDAAKDAAIDANAKALCERIFSCCSEAELADLSFVDVRSPPTQEGCVALHQKNGRDYKPPTDEAVAKGRVALHLERSDACVAEVRALSCSAFHARLVRLHLGDAYGLCNPAIVEPLVADGAECASYLDCKSGSCEGGACRPFPAAGEPCAPDGCAAGMRCNPDTAVCDELVAKGGDCTSDEACASGACRAGKCATPGRCGGG